jgi:ribosomal protein S18 acetylase RimI-like enzyme
VLDEPRHAEVAVAVGDRFQGRGLGRALFAALTASARHRGIERFFFSVQPSNQPVLRMLQGIQTELDESEGLITGSFDLVDVASQPRDSEFVDLLESVRHPA